MPGGPLPTLGSLVGKGASVKLRHRLRGRRPAGGCAPACQRGGGGEGPPGCPPRRQRGCLTGRPLTAADVAGGGGRALSPTPAGYRDVPPPRLPGGNPWLPPRPQLLFPGPGYHGRPRRLTGLRGAERPPPPPSAGARLRPLGAPRAPVRGAPAGRR